MKHTSPFKILLFSLFIITLFSSCEESLNGSGEIITKEHTTLGFNFVEFNTVGVLNIHQGDEQSIVLITNENLHDAMLIESINNRLILDVEDGHSIQDYDILQFDITIPSITGAELDGSGNIFFIDSISGESFRIALNGSGNIHVEYINSELLVTKINGSGSIVFDEALTKNLHLSIDGSGDISMSGETDIQNININGSGNIFNFNIPSKTSNINSNGSGNCEASTSDFLNVDISGSGNVYYNGSATIDSNISGSGQLIHTP